MIIFNLVHELLEKLELNKKKDIKILERVVYDFDSNSISKEKIDEAMKAINKDEVADILEKNLNNPIVFNFSKREFELEKVRETLGNEKFVYFLIKSNLINRTINLKEYKCTAFIIRLYFSILTFLDYEKKE